MAFLQILLVRTRLQVFFEGVSALERGRRDGGFVNVGVDHCGGLAGRSIVYDKIE